MESVSLPGFEWPLENIETTVLFTMCVQHESKNISPPYFFFDSDDERNVESDNTNVSVLTVEERQPTKTAKQNDMN